MYTVGRREMNFQNYIDFLRTFWIEVQGGKYTKCLICY